MLPFVLRQRLVEHAACLSVEPLRLGIAKLLLGLLRQCLELRVLQRQGNTPLFTAVISNYNQHLGAVDSGLRATEAAFVREQVSQLGRSTPFDLYGGVDQQVNHTPAEMTTMVCGNAPGYPSLAAPYNLKNSVPNYSHTVLADYLKVKTVMVYLGGQWLNVRRVCSGAHCFDRGRHRAIISVYVDKQVVARRFVDAAETEVVKGQAVVRTFDGWEQAPFYKAQFEALFLNATPTPPEPLHVSPTAVGHRRAADAL